MIMSSWIIMADQWEESTKTTYKARQGGFGRSTPVHIPRRLRTMAWYSLDEAKEQFKQRYEEMKAQEVRPFSDG
jgi:hypothetical protein